MWSFMPTASDLDWSLGKKGRPTQPHLRPSLAAAVADPLPQPARARLGLSCGHPQATQNDKPGDDAQKNDLHDVIVALIRPASQPPAVIQNRMTCYVSFRTLPRSHTIGQ